MNLFAEMSSELLELVNGLSLPVKVGWPVFVLWCVAQIVWFRRARIVPLPPPAPRTSTLRTTNKRTSSPRTAAPSLRAGGSPEFLAALGLDPKSDVSTNGS